LIKEQLISYSFYSSAKFKKKLGLFFLTV